MQSAIVAEYDHRPSTFGYMVGTIRPYRGLLKSGGFPPLSVRWKSLRIDRRNLQTFIRLTGLSGDAVPVLYPHVFGFRLQMALLTHRDFPMPIWRSLQVRNHMLLHKTFGTDEVLDLETRVAGQRILDKCAEVDLYTTLCSGGELLWEGLNTYFYRGRFGPAQESSSLARSPRPDGPEMARWRTLSTVGWHFGKLTGDYNPLHLWTWYARLFGFKAAFHHPQLVLGQCMARLPEPRGTSQRLDAWVKGPVFYGTDVRLRTSTKADGVEFALTVGAEARPSIVGGWRAVPYKARLINAQDEPIPLNS